MSQEPSPPRANHLIMLRHAIEISDSCVAVAWYGVGCVITSRDGTILSTGFTGELKIGGKDLHAEEIALTKITEQGKTSLLSEATIYSTLEPCSMRASGSTPCVNRIIDAGIKQVVFGAHEPFDETLQIDCRGEELLISAGVSVIQLEEMAEECLAACLSHRKGR